MKKLVILLLLLLPAAAFGQAKLAGRASVEADYKVLKGFHLNVEEEVRVEDGLAGLGSLRTTLDASYKFNKYVKAGVGYTLINPYKDEWSNFNAPRHRLYADVTGTLPLGDFQLFLKERLQFTHRTGDFNVYQTTPNALVLKSRLGVKYKRFKNFEPSLSFEIRTALNEPWGTIDDTAGLQTKKSGDRAGETYYKYTHTGYTHLYNNRYRVNLGMDWKLAKHHTFAPYLLFDYCSDYVLDTNGEGTKLWSATTGYVDVFRISIGLGYKFSF